MGLSRSLIKWLLSRNPLGHILSYVYHIIKVTINYLVVKIEYHLTLVVIVEV